MFLHHWLLTQNIGRRCEHNSRRRSLFIALFLGTMLFSECCWGQVTSAAVDDNARQLELWYSTPAEAWTEALPVGNGQLGGMVFGRLDAERIQFNHDTLWIGCPRSYVHTGAAEVLPRLRELLLAGKQGEAERLASERFMSVPLRQMAYQPFGDVHLELPGHQAATDYRRSLDLDRAVAVTEYTLDGARIRREVFSSFPDQALIIRLTSDRPASLQCNATLNSPQADLAIRPADSRTLVLTGRVKDNQDRRVGLQKGCMSFAAHLRLLECDGSVDVQDDTIAIKQASSVTMALTAATSFVSYQDNSADPVQRSMADSVKLKSKSYDDLLSRHMADHRALFRRVHLELEGAPSASLPTDDRVLANETIPDNGLAALLFQYGRYLLIASSRPGSQPANLQGIWNDEMRPPWDSKYTTNINTEMNYWPSEPCNLTECGEPLFQAIRELADSGSETARVHYDADGWVHHHNFDLWRGTAPINASDHGIWVTGGAWLCQHLWWHYVYTGDKEFLQTTAYPLMRGASQFFVDFLAEDSRSKEHWLISGPSNSPEQGGLVMGPAMDHQIIRNLFAATIEASEQLQVDVELRQQLGLLLPRIAPNQVGRLGQLQEWLEDVDDPQNRHRHVSHLWGLFPGQEICLDTPELFRAARKSLELRGDGGTGWSLAWKINLWARLQDGDHAHRMVQNLLRLTGSPKARQRGGGVYPNLFDAHPPFQIDGNFGFASGVCEMLVQSHRRTAAGEYVIELLPALPSAWPSGSVSGLKTRGGVTLAMRWDNEQLQAAQLTPTRDGPIVVRSGEHEWRFAGVAGETVVAEP